MVFIRSKFSSGEFVSLTADTYVGKSMQLYGEWSYGEIEAIGQFVGQDSNVVEVGSNIGSHTAFIARDLCPNGRIFAFEPRRVLFQILCTNMILNDITNVDARQCAVGEKSSTLHERVMDLETEDNFGALALGSQDGDGEEIRIVTLDSLLDCLPKIQLLKADVEGHELAVLKGAHDLLTRDRPVLYVENDRIDLSQQLMSHISSLNYSMYWHFVSLFRPDNFAGEKENIFGGTISCNLLCLPDELAIGVDGLDLADDLSYHPLSKFQHGQTPMGSLE